MEEYLEHGRKTNSSILCVVDFTQSSNRALHWAVSQAEQQHAHLTVLHTFRLMHANGKALLMKQKQEEQALIDFEWLEKTLLQDHPITYEFRSEVGFIIDRIQDHTTKK